MNDKEKVELGIKACWFEYFSHQCCDCPYMPDRNDKKCVERLGADALALLKEQEAVSVDVCGQMFTVKYGHCPKCNEGLNSEVYPHWCGFCGQAVKWE